jgi:hypothetical protein
LPQRPKAISSFLNLLHYKTEANDTTHPTALALNGAGSTRVRIPAKPITYSELMAITVPSDADRRRSEATLDCSYHAEVIGIRQSVSG